MRVERPGTTAYLKLAWTAPAAADPDFVPMLVLDAALSGAKGVNLWASFRNPPQRSTRLYRALVEKGLASSVFGALLPTEEPFLYSVSCTVADGAATASVEAAADEALAAVRADGITPAEFERARHQLRARLVFESDSVTNIAHQIGYFHTLGDVDLYHGLEARLAAVTLDDVARVARTYLAPSKRTVGWFEPIVESPAAGDADDDRRASRPVAAACRAAERRHRHRAAHLDAPRGDDSCQRRRRIRARSRLGARARRTSSPRSSIAAPSRIRPRRWPRRSTAAASRCRWASRGT